MRRSDLQTSKPGVCFCLCGFTLQIGRCVSPTFCRVGGIEGILSRGTGAGLESAVKTIKMLLAAALTGASLFLLQMLHRKVRGFVCELGSVAVKLDP